MGIKSIAKKMLPGTVWRLLKKLKGAFPKKIHIVLKKGTAIPCRAVYDANINAINIDTCYQDGNLHFTGDIAPLRESPARFISVYSCGVHLGRTVPVFDQNNRLVLDIIVPLKWSFDIFEFFLELENQTEDYLGNFQLSYMMAMKEYEKKLAEKSRVIPEPPGEIIFITQGNERIDVYLQSGAQGIFKLKNIFLDLGISPNEIRTILDFGCGSGRLLRAFYADDPSLSLYGADYNEELVAWAKKNFPPSVHYVKNELCPPLPFAAGQFDLVYLVSVFTHLPLDLQQKWMEEFKRIIKKGKFLVVTLHGMAYLDYFKRILPRAYETLLKEGYSSTNSASPDKPGSNAYFSAHLPEYAANTIFKDWEILAYLPGGKFRNYLATFNMMSFSGCQDIYILTHL